jgi:hypothetical protein
MNTRIENRLNRQDFVKLADSLRDKSVDSVELLPSIDYGFLKVSSLVVSRDNKGYSITSRMLFNDPIGNTVCVHMGIEELGLRKSPKKIELDLRKPLVCDNEIAKDIAYSLSLIEGVVNYACMIRDEQRFDVFIVESKLIARQIGRSKIGKERNLRREKIEPFAIVHADSGIDLRIQSDDLIPLYEEYDRWDLYGGKKAYRLLPRSFALKLLKCDDSALIPEEQFDDMERKTLDDLVKKKYIKSRRIAGKTHYFGLDKKTRIYLIKALRREGHSNRS